MKYTLDKENITPRILKSDEMAELKNWVKELTEVEITNAICDLFIGNENVNFRDTKILTIGDITITEEAHHPIAILNDAFVFGFDINTHKDQVLRVIDFSLSDWKWDYTHAHIQIYEKEGNIRFI